MAIPINRDIDLGGVAKIINVVDPSDPQDAATKAYVDSGSSGLSQAQVLVRSVVKC